MRSPSGEEEEKDLINSEMDTQLSRQQKEYSSGQAVKTAWYVTTQVVVLALLALVLYWFSLPAFNKADADSFQNWHAMYTMYAIPLILLASASFATVIVPYWRRSQFAAFLGGVTLATACWLSSTRSWELTYFTEADPPAIIPLILPIIMGVAILIAAFGLIARVGIIRGDNPIGKGALAATLLLFVASAICYTVINFTPYFHQPPLSYDISRAQISEMLASISIFLPAIWLGGVSLRRETRWAFQPLGIVIVLAFFLALWQSR